jgi:hypothetical protein
MRLCFAQYGYGDATQRDQLSDILAGKVILHGGATLDEAAKAQTVSSDGLRHIYLAGTTDGTNINESLAAAVTMGHEAYRDGVVTRDNATETYNAVLGHTEKALRMLVDGHKGILDYEPQLVNDINAYSSGAGNFASYVNANYDSSADYWKLTEKAGKLSWGKDGSLDFTIGDKTYKFTDLLRMMPEERKKQLGIKDSSLLSETELRLNESVNRILFVRSVREYVDEQKKKLHTKRAEGIQKMVL